MEINGCAEKYIQHTRVVCKAVHCEVKRENMQIHEFGPFECETFECVIAIFTEVKNKNSSATTVH